MNKDELRRILWQGLEILQSKYALSESIGCVSQLLLLKRSSDLLKTESKTFTEIRRSTHIATALQNLARQLKLDDIASESNFWSRFDDETLQNLIRLFSELDLTDEHLSNSELGEVYEKFIEKNVTVNSRDPYTPKQITNLVVGLMRPQQHESVYDPACGFGEFLIECANFIGDFDRALNHLNLNGQDATLQRCEIAKVNLMLYRIENFDIRLGNAVIKPCFTENSEPKLFDVVLTNPPFNLKYSSQNFELSARFKYGIPRNGNGNFLFIQHILSSLKCNGRAAVLLPRSVLFSRGDEEKIRRNIIDGDLIEAVIELAPKLFYHVSIPVVVMILNRCKAKQNNILFIDASREFKAERKQNLLESEHIDRIISTYRDFQDEEEFSRLVSVEEVKINHCDLSVNRYILRSSSNQEIDVADKVRQFQELEANCASLLKQNAEHLKALGIEM